MARKKKVNPAVDDSFGDSFGDSIDESIAVDDSEIGKSSNELPADDSDNSTGDQTVSESKSKFAEIVKEFTVFDAFLLISLTCITLATLRIFFAMSQYGGYFWSKPWSIVE